jgi:hypothetical protein
MKTCPFKTGVDIYCQYDGCMAWHTDNLIYSTSDPLDVPKVIPGFCKLIEKRG